MTDFPRTDPNRLIETYRSYSHAIGAEILKKLPPAVDRDDVFGAAELGLVEAAKNFDPSRGVLFKTFAYYRIRGAIYDALRKMGWLKGEVKLRFEAGANEYLKDYTEGENRETAVPASEAHEELRQLTTAVVTSYILSLDAGNRELEDTKAVPADQAIEERERHSQLKDAMSRLPDNNRRVIEDYYFHDVTLEEIGRKLGLSKSWVCRLHAKSLDMLRELMQQQPAGKAVSR